MSEDEAVRRLDVQQRAAGLLEELQRALGDEFAGVWIDPGSGRVAVGLLSSDSRPLIERILAPRELVVDTDIVPVASSTADIQAAHYTLGIEMADAISDGRVLAQTDDAANAVNILLTPRANADDRARAKLLRSEFASGRDAYGPPLPPPGGAAPDSQDLERLSPQPARERTVELQIQSVPETVATPTVTCSTESCSPPLRAGVKITNNGDARRCSAGFIGAWWSGSSFEHFIHTAGHCIKGTNSNWHWRAYNPEAGNSNNIGVPWSWRYGANFGNVYPGLSLDIGIIHIDSGGYWGSSITNALWMHGWPNNVLWSIAAQAAAVQGQYGCRTGYASAFTCGTISSVNGTAAYGQGEGGVTNLLIIPGACPVAGDSGGAFVDGGTALGITSGRQSWGDGTCAWGMFAHAEDVGNWLGVWALHS